MNILVKVKEVDKITLLEELEEYQLVSAVLYLKQVGKLIEEQKRHLVCFLHELSNLGDMTDSTLKGVFHEISSKYPHVACVFDSNDMKGCSVPFQNYTFSDKYPQRFYANLPDFSLLVMYLN